jgi:PrcB C-terminal
VPPRLIVALILGACAHAASRTESSRSRAPQESGDTLVRLFHSAFDGPSEGVREVVRDSVEWRKAWIHTRSTPTDSAPPPVDFKKQMVVIAGMGNVPSTGYELFIDSVTTVEWGTLIYIRTAGCAADGMATQPVDIVRVPRTTLPVQFVEYTEINHC